MRAHHHYYSLTNKVLSKLDEKQRIFINSLIFVNKQLILLFNYLKKPFSDFDQQGLKT